MAQMLPVTDDIAQISSPSFSTSRWPVFTGVPTFRLVLVRFNSCLI
jgi:hypothetical protein